MTPTQTRRRARTSTAVRVRLALAVALSSVLAVFAGQPAQALTPKDTTLVTCFLGGGNTEFIQVKESLAVVGSGYVPAYTRIYDGWTPSYGTIYIDRVRVIWYNTAGLVLQDRTFNYADFDIPSNPIVGPTGWTSQATYRVKVILSWNGVEQCRTAKFY